MSLKDLLSGKVKSFLSLLGIERETAVVASPRKKYPKVLNDKPNQIQYKVKMNSEPVVYRKLKDAKLLVTALALAGRPSDIIRIETTSEGFFVSERKIK